MNVSGSEIQPASPQAVDNAPKLIRPDTKNSHGLRKVVANLDMTKTQTEVKRPPLVKLSNLIKSVRLPSENTLKHICQNTTSNLAKVSCGLLNKLSQPRTAAPDPFNKYRPNSLYTLLIGGCERGIH